MLDKTLTQLDAADAQILALREQVSNFQAQTAKQTERFNEVVKILQEYAGLDNKAKKGFWKKVGAKLTGFIDTLTDPSTIREILLVIALIKSN